MSEKIEKPMPTVEDLVQIFRDNKWVPTRLWAEPDSYQTGKCCAIPAVIKYYDPEWRPTKGESFYDKSNKLIGELETDYLYSGFDGAIHRKDGKDKELKRNPWRKLGHDLYWALQQ